MSHRKYLGVLTLALCSLTLQAQTTFTGDWQGALRFPVGSLRLVLHLKQTGQSWSGILDSPDQQAFGLPLDGIRITGDSLYFSASALGLSYAGKQASAGTLQGQFSQGGLTLPLKLQRATPSSHEHIPPSLQRMLQPPT